MPDWTTRKAQDASAETAPATVDADIFGWDSDEEVDAEVAALTASPVAFRGTRARARRGRRRRRRALHGAAGPAAAARRGPRPMRRRRSSRGRCGRRRAGARGACSSRRPGERAAAAAAAQRTCSAASRRPRTTRRPGRSRTSPSARGAADAAGGSRRGRGRPALDGAALGPRVNRVAGRAVRRRPRGAAAPAPPPRVDRSDPWRPRTARPTGSASAAPRRRRAAAHLPVLRLRTLVRGDGQVGRL